jgi:hypothetical protein
VARPHIAASVINVVLIDRLLNVSPIVKLTDETGVPMEL